MLENERKKLLCFADNAGRNVESQLLLLRSTAHSAIITANDSIQKLGIPFERRSNIMHHALLELA